MTAATILETIYLLEAGAVGVIWRRGLSTRKKLSNLGTVLDKRLVLGLSAAGLFLIGMYS